MVIAASVIKQAENGNDPNAHPMMSRNIKYSVCIQWKAMCAVYVYSFSHGKA